MAQYPCPVCGDEAVEPYFKNGNPRNESRRNVVWLCYGCNQLVKWLGVPLRELVEARKDPTRWEELQDRWRAEDRWRSEYLKRERQKQGIHFDEAPLSKTRSSSEAIRRDRPTFKMNGWLTRKIAAATILAMVVAFSAGIGVGFYIGQIRTSISVTTSASAPLVLLTSAVTSTATTPLSFHSSATSAPEWLPTTNQVVSWDQASNYVGQYVTVEGTIVYTYYSSYSGTYFLDFHNPYQGYFAAVIFSSGSGSFTCSITDFYLNKEVRITGTISLYQGQPQIIVSSPSQIEVAYMGFPCS